MSAESTHYRTCPLCEAVCGLEITVGDGRVRRIAGDRSDVFSRGFICPKGASLHGLHDDPDRLRRPLVRRGDDPDRATWEEVTWDEAFAEVDRRLSPLLQRHGRQALAFYMGNPNAHTLAGAFYARPLIKSGGTRNIFSASTVDQMPKEVACGLMFGRPSAFTVPDIDRSDYLLMLGANPWESNGSLCTAPDFPGRLKALRQRGGRLVVVDPKRTRTAEHADEHIPVRPGSDAYLLMGMVRVLFDESLVNLGRLAPWINGVERLRELAAPYHPDAVARKTGVSPDVVPRLARELAAAPRAAVYGRIGTHAAQFGTLAAWAVDVLNALSGHLDEPGGAMWPLSAHQRHRAPGPGRGFITGRHRSRVKGYPEVRGELPVATLADEIETPGDGQVRALITVAGNPALSTPDSGRLQRALAGLSCMVSVDPYRNETTRYAHVILPPPSALERSHYDVAFYSLAVRNTAKWSAPVFPAAGPPEEDILARLALVVAGQGPSADPRVIHGLVEQQLLTQAIRDVPELSDRSVDELRAQLTAGSAVDRIVEILVRSGAYGDRFGQDPDGLDFERLRAAEHGIDLGPLGPRVPEIIETPSGRIELAPDPIVDEVARLTAELVSESAQALLLIGRRHLRSNNSWMHNVDVLVRGKPRCTLQMHPTDAHDRQLSDGQQVCVSGRVGSVVAQLELTQSLMPGVVSLPHGWGHAEPGSQLTVARTQPGVNSNILTDGERLDPLSGNAVLNGIPVEVLPA